MKTLFTLAFSLIVTSAFAQSPNLVWAQKMELFQHAYFSSDERIKSTVDSAGYIYAAGQFDRPIDFDPGPGTKTLAVDTGFFSTYIAKYNPQGGLVWAKQIKSQYGVFASEIKLDGRGGLYLSGYYEDTTDFDPGPGKVLKPSDGHFYFHGYLLKLDTAGVFTWVATMDGVGSNPPDAYASRISFDSARNVYVGGRIDGTNSFGSGVTFGSTVLKAEGPGSIKHDNFLCKILGQTGAFAWAVAYGGSNDAISIADLETDARGNSYLVGTMRLEATPYAVDFDPGPGKQELTPSRRDRYDTYILKLKPDGSFGWVKRIDANAYGTPFTGVTPNHISLDTSSNVYIAGTYFDTVDFDPGAGVSLRNVVGKKDIFVLKLDSSGIFNWAKSFGGIEEDNVASLNIDAKRNLYLGGDFDSTVDFNPGAGVFTIASRQSSRDIFFQKLDAAGDFVWAGSVGGGEYDIMHTSSIDSAGNIFVWGFFNVSADFDPCAGSSILSSSVDDQVFLMRLGQAGCAGGNLPVVLSNFIVENNNCKSTLSWTTLSEQNSSHFDVQYSIDGVSFKSLGSVTATGNSSVSTNYSYTHSLSAHAQSPTIFYRLHAIDKDGSGKFSRVVNVSNNCNTQVINAYPNPAKTTVNVTGLNGDSELRLVNQFGQLVTTVKSTNRSEVINVSGLPSGQYILQFIQNGKHVQNIKLMKN